MGNTVKKIGGTILNVGKKVVGGVKTGLEAVKRVGGIIGNVPIIGDIAKFALKTTPIGQMISTGFKAVEGATDVADKLTNDPSKIADLAKRAYAEKDRIKDVIEGAKKYTSTISPKFKDSTRQVVDYVSGKFKPN